MNRKIVSFILAVMLCLMGSGCDTRSGTPDEVPSGESSGSSSSEREKPEATEPVETTDAVIAEFTDSDSLIKQIAVMKEQNDHTAGWLVVPNTGINDVVLHNAEDTTNEYYLRRNFNKEDDFDGVYYTDFRAVFGDGSRDALGQNTCIFGHSMTDVETDEKYTVKLGELHNFRDPAFAEKTPYLIFSTEKEVLVWEVFAVFIGNRNAFPYNRNDLGTEEFYRVVTEEVLPRSIYDYDVELNEDDKFLTFSTCIYNLPDGTKTGYPDTHLRYGIMARLVNPDEALKDKASFKENADFVVDEDNWPN